MRPPACQRCHAPMDEPRRQICRQCSREQSARMAAWCFAGMAVILVVAACVRLLGG